MREKRKNKPYGVPFPTITSCTLCIPTKHTITKPGTAGALLGLEQFHGVLATRPFRQATAVSSAALRKTLGLICGISIRRKLDSNQIWRVPSKISPICGSRICQRIRPPKKAHLDQVHRKHRPKFEFKHRTICDYSLFCQMPALS